MFSELLGLLSRVGGYAEYVVLIIDGCNGLGEFGRDFRGLFDHGLEGRIIRRTGQVLGFYAGVLFGRAAGGGGPYSTICIPQNHT